MVERGPARVRERNSATYCQIRNGASSEGSFLANIRPMPIAYGMESTKLSSQAKIAASKKTRIRPKTLPCVRCQLLPMLSNTPDLSRPQDGTAKESLRER